MIQKVSYNCCTQKQAFGNRVPKRAAVEAGKELISRFAGANASASSQFLASEEVSKKILPVLERNPKMKAKDLIAGIKEVLAI